MMRKGERLAALAAGDELSAIERRRHSRELSESASGRALTEEFKAQRAKMLALRDQSLPGGDVGRTLSVLRTRAAQHELSQWPFGDWLVPAGVLAALVVSGLLAWHWTEERLAMPVPPPAIVAAVPDPPVLRRVEARQRPDELPERISVIEVAPAVLAGRTDVASTPEQHPLQPAMDRVEEILSQPDGTVRLKLTTRNPNVVIYLVQGEPEIAETLNETDGVGGE